MNNWTIVFIVSTLLLGIPPTYPKSLPGDPTYVGAVVEYFPCNVPNNQTIFHNVANYREFIKQANESNADIIVFPEIGLVGYDGFVEEILMVVPDPKDNIVPCIEFIRGDYSIPLAKLSCHAREFEMYIVANLPEKVPCSKDKDKKCPDSGRYRYNTNVVFDRKGAVIARYRKYNLFDEGDTNVPQEPEAVYFDTDFDVRFGTFICFDILFARPALDLVTKYQVTDIAYPTAWFSELPFLTALGAQHGFAYVHDVNFLASGYNNVSVGSGGSGIYLGRSPNFIRTMPEGTTSTVLTFEIPKKSKSSFLQKPLTNIKSTFSGLESNIHQRIVRATNQIAKKGYLFEINDDPETPVDCIVNTGQPYTLNLLSDDSIQVYNSYQLNYDLDQGKLEKMICDRDQFCCNFTVDYENQKAVSHSYRAVVFNGVRKYGMTATAGVQLCSIILCTGPDITDCTFRLKDKDFGYVFNNIQITGYFLKTNASQFPDTLTDGDHLVPLSTNQFEFSVESNDDDDVNRVKMELKSVQSELTTFGIYGRVFTRDGELATAISASINLQNTILMTVMTVFAAEYIRRLYLA